jgi:hypothetical protein
MFIHFGVRRARFSQRVRGAHARWSDAIRPQVANLPHDIQIPGRLAVSSADDQLACPVGFQVMEDLPAGEIGLELAACGCETAL